MPELPDTIFESSKITKEQVIQAFLPFLEKGVRNPADLDTSDPEVVKAEELYSEWAEQLRAEVPEQDDIAEHLALLEAEMFFIEMGFIDPKYVQKVKEEILSTHEFDPYAENPEEDVSPLVYQKVNEKLTMLESLILDGEIREDLTDEEIVEFLGGNNAERQRLRSVKISIFHWFMRHINEAEKAENPETAKGEFKAMIWKLWPKIGYYEWLSDLSKVYLEGKKAMGADKRLLKELAAQHR